MSPAAYKRSFSLGCVPHTLALCSSEHDIDQLGRVISMLGTLCEESWPAVKSLPDYGKISFPSRAALPWEEILTGPAATAEARALGAVRPPQPPAKLCAAQDPAPNLRMPPPHLPER